MLIKISVHDGEPNEVSTEWFVAISLVFVFCQTNKQEKPTNVHMETCLVKK